MDNNNLTREELEAAKELLRYNKAINHSVTQYMKLKDKVAKKERDIIKMRQSIATLEQEALDGNEELIKGLKDKLKEMESGYRIERAALESVSKQKMLINKLDKATTAAYAGYVGLMTKYLLDAQKSYKVVNRELGLSGQRTLILEKNLSSATEYGHRLGMSLEDISKIQSSYSEETGRAVLLNRENLKYVTQISKGLGISAEESGKLVGMMDNYGLSVEASANFYEKTLKSSRSLGLNASKVVKTINENLSKSQQYVFKDGIQGVSKMAQYAVKFKTSMESVFNAMDKANNIEGAVDMVSNLQVIGGKFASLDFHTVLYQARNDAEGFAKTMTTLTKGMATFNATTGEFEIQAGDLQRLKLAAEATGMSYEDMIKSAKEVAKVDRLDQQLFGKGLTKDQKDFISSIASIDKGGKFTVDIGDGVMRDVRSLTGGQIKTLQQTSAGLEEAAKNAIAFDESWKNLINETKSLFLPLVKALNSGVEIMNNEFVRNFLKGAVLFGGAFVAMKSIFGGIKKLIQFLSVGSNGKGILGEFISSVKDLLGRGGLSGRLRGNGGSGSPIPPSVPDDIERTGRASSGAWKNTLAFGGAVLLIGTGIKLATDGLSKLVEQFQFLSSDQAKQANTMVKTLGFTLGALGAGLVAVGYLGSGASLGMLAFGGAITLIGAGIAIASVGVAKLVDKFKELSGEQGKEINKTLLTLGGTLGVLGATMVGVGLIGSTASIGMLAFGASMLMVGGGIMMVGTGIKIATTGLAKLVEQFKYLSSDQAREVTNTVKTLSLALGILGTSVLAIGFLGGSASLGMLAFGTSIALIGTGINIASTGLAKLVEQFKNISGEQGKELNNTIKTLGITLGVLGATMIGIGFLGTTASIGMLAFGGAITMIGTGIAIASVGISKLVESFGKFGSSLNKNINSTMIGNVYRLASGITTLGLASASLANPLTIIGMNSMESSLSDINDSIDASKFNSLLSAGEGMKIFSNSLNSLNDSKLDKLIELTKNMKDLDGLSEAIFNLKDVLSKDIEVKFKEQLVNIQLEITNELGGQYINKISKLIPQKIQDAKQGL